jgi:hypothetical protein
LHSETAIDWPVAHVQGFRRDIVHGTVVRALVILLVFALVAFVARRVWRAMLALRVGAIPDDVDVPQVTMEPDRGWQVTRSVRHGVATINVEHPTEGIARTWTIALREPGAARALEQAMHRAGLLARELSTT